MQKAQFTLSEEIEQYNADNLKDELKKCIQCGFCNEVSATYQYSKDPSKSHKGQMHIIKIFLNNKA